MQLNLTDEEAATLLNLLTGIIEGDLYPKSRRLRTLRRIRAKLPGALPEPSTGPQAATSKEKYPKPAPPAKRRTR